MRLFNFILLNLIVAVTPVVAMHNSIPNTLMLKSEEYVDSLLSAYAKQLDEVVVVGFKQDKSYQLSPQSASSLSASFLQKENINNIKDITAIVPNLYMPDYGSKLTSPIYIRGIGNKTGTPAIGLYIDGIPYFQQSTFDFNLHQIAQIDVLKGPQGTLYGRNTMGGVIDVNTKSPLDKQGSDFRITAGNYNHYILSANHSRLLKENMALAISGSYNYDGGYYTNEFLNKKADESKASTGRLRYDWKINSDWLLKIITSLDYTNQGGYPYAKYNSNKHKIDPIRYDGESSYRRLISSTGVNIQYTGVYFKINSQSSFQFYTDHQRIDQDFTEKPLNFTKQNQQQHMASEEVTIKSVGHSKYKWLFGAFGFYQKIKNEVDVDFIPQEYHLAKTYNMPTYGIALYHQSTLNNIFLDGLSANAGVRFDYEHAENTYSSFKNTETVQTPTGEFIHKLKFNQVTPKFTLQYLSSTEQNFYGTITRGYKTGGFNTSFDSKKDRTYKPEYSWNYEVGAKINFFQNRLKADITLFYIDWKDQQVAQPMPTGVGRVIRNAGKSISKGVELGVLAQFSENFVLRANYGYTKANYRKYNYVNPKDNQVVDYKDKKIPNLPNQTVSADASYTFKPLRFVDTIELGLTYLGTGKIYWTDNNAFEQKYYSILNARIAIQKGDIGLSLWSKNITHTNYTSYCFMTSSLHGQQGRPFTIGGTLTYSF